MATFKMYDTLGTGVNMSDEESSLLDIDLLDVDDNPRISRIDGDTVRISFSMADGAIRVKAVVTELNYFTMRMDSISIANSKSKPMLEASDLNLIFDDNGNFPDLTSSLSMLSGNDRITGNNYADMLLSSTGNDTLDGMGGNDVLDGGDGRDSLVGGAGADTMLGGSGDDTYVVDNAGDRVVETQSQYSSTDAGGTDLVQSSVSFNLAAQAGVSFVENLTLTGTAAVNATGNALANVLTGNKAANVLNGGAGADTLIGGEGNDVYVVDHARDDIRETSTNGKEIDTVQSSLSWTLGANLEKLVLTGSANLNGSGNAAANTLTGNAGANVLDGGAGKDTLAGGAGNDTLVGGAGTDRLAGEGGKDVFRFAAWTDLGLGSSRDAIVDFVPGQDLIDLSLLDAKPALAGNQAFTLVSGSAFGTAPGQLTYANGVISFNTDTDKAAEFELQLVGTVPKTLAAGDFVL
ncbi:calcium-binding protein [Azohydromonas aeria]|uniref:calcium-binding protein n=1 Tax=Azohydromonas aeria TaxID=2590212 RepID=UPI0012F8DED3|nr:calcium-binding protein [Azohydromonas aeria]